jgi:hypothetical protein
MALEVELAQEAPHPGQTAVDGEGGESDLLEMGAEGDQVSAVDRQEQSQRRGVGEGALQPLRVR